MHPDDAGKNRVGIGLPLAPSVHQAMIAKERQPCDFSTHGTLALEESSLLPQKVFRQ